MRSNRHRQSRGRLAGLLGQLPGRCANFEVWMLETLRGVLADMRERQILRKLGVASSIAIIATACYILYHMLKGLDVDDLYEALRDTEARTVALAGLCVA